MEKDDKVFLYGLDVGDHKETFGSTVGLKKKFGEKRVFATPLSEDANCGLGIGAAVAGLRPINIHIRADFLLLCMNQLANIAGIVRYYSNGKLQCPITVRAVIGRGWGQGSQHSKEIYQMFESIPGIRVVVPSSPQDAYSLLRASIECNDPVVFFEHRWLYDIEGDVDTDFTIPKDFWKITLHGRCGWEVIEELNDKFPLPDSKGRDFECPLPPVPTCRHLEDEYYKKRYNKENINTYEHRFKGPF